MDDKKLNRRNLILAISVAVILEAVLLACAIYWMTTGGIEVGGRMFSLLHVPSSTIIGMLFSMLLDTGSSKLAETLYVLLVPIMQIALFTFVVLFGIELVGRLRSRQKH
jgi:hypothetical protein